MDKSKKKISITLVMCIIALLLIIGGSYALWNKTIETENSGLEVYSTELNLLESDSEIINIENAFPMIDEVGMKQEETFDFEVKTKTKKDINIRYDLVIEKIGLKCSEIENPTVEEHYECYDMTISEEDRQKLINYMSEYLDLTIEEATEYYDLLYTKDDEGLKDFYIRIYDITEEIAEENVAEDKDRGYIHWIIYNYENDYGFELSVKKTDYEMLPLSTREIQETYTFNSENRIFYNNLYDDEIKVYLTDYENNVLAGPIKISELGEDYVIYTKENSHEEQEEIKNKYKLRAWIDEEVKPEYWEENVKLNYQFKIGVKTTPNYNANVVVQNGTVDGDSSKLILRNENAEFNIVPNEEKTIGYVNCTRGQTGVYENNKLIVENITSNTTCTVRLTTDITTLYEDGTFIINEHLKNREQNIANHGNVIQEYEAMSENQSYYFWSDYNRLWNDQKANIINVEIGQEIMPTSTAYWFHHCYNMTTGKFENLNTTNVTDMSYMFYRTYDLNALTGLEKWDTSSVYNMSYMFNEFGFSIEDEFAINGINKWDTSNVINMKYMFSSAGYNSDKFTLDLSNWDTSNVENMHSMFDRSGNQSSVFKLIGLDGWDVTKVMDMGWMFRATGYNATEWSIGNLSNWKTSSATNMYIMFFLAGYSANDFDIGDLSNWDVSKVTDMGSMFEAAGYNAQNWNIGDLSGWNTSSVNNMLGTFSRAGANSETFNLNLSNWNVTKVNNMRSMFTNAGSESKEVTINLSGWDTSTVKNMQEMFSETGQNATTLKLIGLDTWKTQNVTTMYRMFYKAGYSASTFDIGNISSWNTSQVTDMQQMFYNTGYSATYTLDLSGWNVQNVTSHNSFNNGVTSKITPPVWVN